MTKALHCRDAGFDCDFVARTDDEDELMRQVALHAKSSHGIDEVAPEMASQIKSLVREE